METNQESITSGMISFEKFMKLRETNDNEKIPKNLPIEMPIPPELEAINATFKNERLKVIDHEIKTPKPGIPDKKIVGERLASIPFEMRNKLKASGNKLYVIGDAVQEYLRHHIHVASQSPEEIWDFKGKIWTLATSAHPEIVKLVLMHGIHNHILPPGAKITEKNGQFGIKINGKNFEIQSFSKQGTDVEGNPKSQYTPSMFRDFENRKTLYYDIDSKKAYDYHTLISDIEGSPKANAQKDTTSSSSPIKKAETPIKPSPNKPMPRRNEEVETKGSWFC